MPLAVTVGDIVRVYGDGAPGTEVEVLAGGKVVGTAVVDADGAWRFAVVFATPGVQYIGCRAADDAELSLTATIAAYVNVSPVLPTPTATPSATLAQTPIPVQVETSNLEADDAQQVVVTGRAAPSATVEIVIENGQVYTVIADRQGLWTSAVVLPDCGEYPIVVRATDVTGGVSEIQIMVTAPTPVPTAAPTATVTPTNTPMPTATNTATPVPTATSTQTPAATATNSATPIPTSTPTATSTATAVPTATNTSTPTATATAVPTATSTETALPTATHTPTATYKPTSVATATALPTATPLPTATGTAVPTATPRPTNTHTVTPVPSATSTMAVPTATDTAMPSATAALAQTATALPAVVSTSTPEPTATATVAALVDEPDDQALPATGASPAGSFWTILWMVIGVAGALLGLTLVERGWRSGS